MYELIQAAGDSYYIDCPVKIGVVKTGENDVVFIDGGSDKDAGKKALRAVREKGWDLKAVFNTHSHADHIGGNAYLQKETGCSIYAQGIEHVFSLYPILEPVGLFGGNPTKELRGKFTLAQPSEAHPLSDAILPEQISVIPLPGHCFDQVGFRTADDVVFLADSLAGRETLEKYKITFLYDVQKYLETLEMIKTMKAAMFVPAHSKATDDITELVDLNIKSVNEISDTIHELCREPVSTDKLLEKIFDIYGLKMSVLQYTLIGNTVKSYLSWMKENDRVEIVIDGNRLLWRSK